MTWYKWKLSAIIKQELNSSNSEKLETIEIHYKKCKCLISHILKIFFDKQIIMGNLMSFNVTLFIVISTNYNLYACAWFCWRRSLSIGFVSARHTARVRTEILTDDFRSTDYLKLFQSLLRHYFYNSCTLWSITQGDGQVKSKKSRSA